ncbi:Urokinase plasminogen activator surface receptor [Channa argus]|uniref:Urokinase plasminogen activator surface receptor n=1 Tax=Channa argus TaxID=215402 RepID=A0A6G1PJJ6_CHAAH|nr:Urokinase plasminogen activator surface receptor [Channa argus]
MMKLTLSLTLIWMLFSTAGALQCESCQGQCSTTISTACPSETMCVTAAIQASTPGNSFTQFYKTCAPTSVCPATGSQTFAVNTSSLSAFASVQCCNTNNCNTATLTPPPALSTSKLQCYSCDYLSTNCSNKIQCTEGEDRCFRANVTIESTFLTMGCASRNLCVATSNPASLTLVKGISNITCCDSNLCNAAQTTTTTLYLLLGLLVFSLY